MDTPVNTTIPLIKWGLPGCLLHGLVNAMLIAAINFDKLKGNLYRLLSEKPTRHFLIYISVNLVLMRNLYTEDKYSQTSLYRHSI